MDDIKRGDVLVVLNLLEELMMLDVKLLLVNYLDKGLKYWDRLRLYYGIREIFCRVVLLDKELIESGESGYV